MTAPEYFQWNVHGVREKARNKHEINPPSLLLSSVKQFEMSVAWKSVEFLANKQQMSFKNCKSCPVYYIIVVVCDVPFVSQNYHKRSEFKCPNNANNFEKIVNCTSWIIEIDVAIYYVMNNEKWVNKWVWQVWIRIIVNSYVKLIHIIVVQ